MKIGTRESLLSVFYPKQFACDELADALTSEKFHDIIHKSVYNDVKRRLSGIGNNTEQRDKILDFIVKEFRKYFSGKVKNADEFIKWHRHLSNKICNEFIKIIDTKKANISFGLGQKIINVAFKSFYMFSDSDEYECYFSHCEFTLDSYTLKWYFDVVEKTISDHTKKVSRDIKWSSMSEEDYNKIQNNIKSYLSSKHNVCFKKENGDFISPFQLEFYVWQYIKFVPNGYFSFSPFQLGEDERKVLISLLKSIPSYAEQYKRELKSYTEIIELI